MLVKVDHETDIIALTTSTPISLGCTGWLVEVSNTRELLYVVKLLVEAGRAKIVAQ